MRNLAGAAFMAALLVLKYYIDNIIYGVIDYIHNIISIKNDPSRFVEKNYR